METGFTFVVDSGDAELHELHQACMAAISGSRRLSYIARTAADGKEVKAKDIDDAYRHGFINHHRAMVLLKRWSLELNAASDGMVRLPSGELFPNWHHACAGHYNFLLVEFWEAIVEPNTVWQAVQLRNGGRSNEAVELLGQLTPNRLLDRQEQFRTFTETLSTLDASITRIELQREFARVIHNRALRPSLSLVLKDGNEISATQRTDDSEKDLLPLPDNPDVLDLCQKLNKNMDRIAAGNATVSGIARDFTGESQGSDQKAQSLLRQARRYSHLWKRADS
jgi:hypothetical protein